MELLAENALNVILVNTLFVLLIRIENAMNKDTGRKILWDIVSKKQCCLGLIPFFTWSMLHSGSLVLAHNIYLYRIISKKDSWPYYIAPYALYYSIALLTYPLAMLSAMVMHSPVNESAEVRKMTSNSFKALFYVKS